MWSGKKRKLLKGMMGVVSLMICLTLLLKCQMVVHAYTEEEKAAAKAWLSAHGYSPDQAGANQAYQDYLNGKFDDELAKGNGDNQTDGTQGDTAPNGNQEAPAEGEKTDVPQADTPQTEGTNEEPEGTSTEGEEEDNNKDKNKPNKSDSNKKDDKDSDIKKGASTPNGEGGNNSGNGQSTPNTSSANQQPDTTEVDNIQTDIAMTPQQEAAFLEFVITEIAKEERKSVSDNRAQRQAELYEQSLKNSNIVSENDATEDESKQPQVQENNSDVWKIWVCASIGAILILGVIAYMILKKK